jgi:hypothetical protein
MDFFIRFEDTVLKHKEQAAQKNAGSTAKAFIHGIKRSS